MLQKQKGISSTLHASRKSVASANEDQSRWSRITEKETFVVAILG